jgi:hypothetical protein
VGPYDAVGFSSVEASARQTLADAVRALEERAYDYSFLVCEQVNVLRAMGRRLMDY